MKTHLLAFVLGTMTAALLVPLGRQLVVTFAPSVQAQENPPRLRVCSPTFVMGTYAISLEGYIVSGNNPGPYGGLGVLTLDGINGAALTISQNYNGTPRPAVTLAGSYSVAANCSGALILNDGSRFEFVASDSAHRLSLLQTISTGVVRGVAQRQ